jgi:signal transduction histidine kinase
MDYLTADYREMEFYLSAKYLDEGETFWTKAYFDAVTRVRMITVVSPIYDNGTFIGVASVDLEIDSQQNILFRDALKSKNSYLMMIDREGTVIGKSPIFNHILANDTNIYDVDNPKLDTLLHHIKPALGCCVTPERFDEELAERLSDCSSDIDTADGERIASLIEIRRENIDKSLSSRVYFVEDDPILGVKSIVAIYHFPFTHWKVVIGIPEDEVLVQSNKTYKQIIIATILLTLLATIFGFILLRRIFINPIASINEQLEDNLSASGNKYKMLTCTDKGEIGALVQNLNTRTSALEDSLEREAMEIQKRVVNEKLLVQQSKMAAMGEMMDAVAHQWKQPLNALSMYSELIKSDFDEGEVDKKYIEQFRSDIQVQIEHMVSTLDEFRNFFRPNEKAEDFQLLDVINSVVFLTKHEFLKHHITVNIERDDSITLHGSPNEFKHLILNLLSNAKDAFNDNEIEKRVITMRLIHQDESDVLEVEDNAGGIPEEVIKDIFKANVTTKEKGKGTGIGLYMSTQIAQKHNATLSVHNLNNGACFVVEFKK